MKSSDALVIPAVGPKLAPELFEGASLKLVQVTGAGVDRLDQPALTRFGIPVANVAGGSNSAVAEYAVTTASMLLRRFAWADAEKVCFFDPATTDPQGIDARPTSLDELLSTSDVVSLHVPLLPATHNLIGAAQLSRMKPGAVLIQGSRGGIVDETALASSLISGHLGGAAVDVYSTEPPAPDNPLLKLAGEAASRLLLTPHLAGVSRPASTTLFRAAWQNVERVLVQKQPPLNRVY